jgi:hypothetical protein
MQTGLCSQVDTAGLLGIELTINSCRLQIELIIKAWWVVKVFFLLKEPPLLLGIYPIPRAVFIFGGWSIPVELFSSRQLPSPILNLQE